MYNEAGGAFLTNIANLVKASIADGRFIGSPVCKYQTFPKVANICQARSRNFFGTHPRQARNAPENLPEDRFQIATCLIRRGNKFGSLKFQELDGDCISNPLRGYLYSNCTVLR
jgi:hypothetical protein